MADHCLAEYHPVAELLLCEIDATGVFSRVGIAAVVGMALDAEPVVDSAHIDLLARGHVEQGQVDGRAARMTRLFGDVAPFKKEGLVLVGIEIRLHQRVCQVLSPADEMVYRALRAVGIIDLEPVTLGFDVVADGLEGFGRLARI